MPLFHRTVESVPGFWFTRSLWLGWVSFRLEVVPQDLWVGVFWKRKRYPRPLIKAVMLPLNDEPSVEVGHDVTGEVHIWICLVPCVPLHVWWWTV